VETRRGAVFPAAAVVANVPPPNLAALLGEAAPRRLAAQRQRPPWPADGWGAFTLYAGLDAAALPPGLALHYQIVMSEPLAEGNAVFLSLSPEEDRTRAPAGGRAATLSAHTAPAPWWDLYRRDRCAYDARVERYTERLLDAAERVVPGFRAATRLLLPGTPVTFQRYTRRLGGWVGGFPQTGLLRTWGPRVGPDLWLVGDSIFPGQSTAAAALGGLRVAHAMLGRHSGWGR
jgi:phytoene dehydrogenase-like protein